MKIVRKVLLILLSCLFMLPVVWTIFCSFLPEEVIENSFSGLISGNSDWSFPEISSISSFSLKQYKSVLISSPDYLYRFWRSVFLVLPIIILQLLISLPSAYAFSQTKSKLLQMFFFLYILMFLVPSQVTVIPLYLTAKKMKLTDTVWSIWLPGIFSGFSIYLLSRRMLRIPAEVLDAARLDGAGETRILISIAIPLSKTEITSCVILLFVDYWNMVEFPVIMFSHPLNYPLSVYLSRVQDGAVGISFAASVIYLIPALLVFLYSEEYL